MTPDLVAPLIAAIVSLLAGFGLRRRLNTLRYRYPDEAALPDPGPHRWVPWTLAAAVAALTWRYTTTGRPDHLVFLLPFAVAGVWLSAVDLDVHRLPFTVTLPSTLIVTAGVLAVTLTRHDPTIGLTSLAGGLLAYSGYWLLHKIGKAGVGHGDLRYAALIGLTAGALSLTTLWWALMLAAFTAAIWVAITRPPGRLPYGPWLTLGTLLAAATA